MRCLRKTTKSESIKSRKPSSETEKVDPFGGGWPPASQKANCAAIVNCIDTLPSADIYCAPSL
jgi:hypothetical protein